MNIKSTNLNFEIIPNHLIDIPFLWLFNHYNQKQSPGAQTSIMSTPNQPWFGQSVNPPLSHPSNSRSIHQFPSSTLGRPPIGGCPPMAAYGPGVPLSTLVITTNYCGPECHVKPFFVVQGTQNYGIKYLVYSHNSNKIFWQEFFWQFWKFLVFLFMF